MCTHKICDQCETVAHCSKNGCIPKASLMPPKTQQPEALRLADALAYCDSSVAAQAAQELRRLHAHLEATHLRELAAYRTTVENLERKVAELEAAPAAQAVEPAVVVPGQRVTVNAGALQMVVNALRRDAAEGKTARDEMADELLATVAPAPVAVAVPDERAAFEAWTETVGLDHLKRVGQQDNYEFVETRRMWSAWQARAALAAAPAVPAPAADAATQAAQMGIRLDFKQASELLGMFGGEPGEVSVLIGDGHSGHGLYAMWAADPEGTVYLGQTDDEAVPDAAPQPQYVQRDALRLARTALASCKTSGYRDVDDDFVRTYYYDRDGVAKAIAAIDAASAAQGEA